MEAGSSLRHVVAVPYPGTGHINPMMNFCKFIAATRQDVLITFVVTEEWFELIRDDPKPDAIRFSTIPNVIPPAHLRAANFPGFYEAVMTKMEEPFELLLDQLKPPVDGMIGDVELRWSIGVGNRRNIPVAAFWTMSASFFFALHHLNIVASSGRSSIGLSEKVEEISALGSSCVEDLKTVIQRTDPLVLKLALECISKVCQAQYLLFTSVYELESLIIDDLKLMFRFPVYTIGPAIPYIELESSCSCPDYMKWLDSRPRNSVLYISLGSFLSVSRSQMDQIVCGLKDSGVPYLWIARQEASRLKDVCSGSGLVLPWCDQLKVLSHPAVGGFWTHCGWNSTLEAVFAGVPMLAFPLFLDQYPNRTQIIEDWKIGRKFKTRAHEELVAREEVADIVRDFMDTDGNEQREMRTRARQLGEKCRRAVAKGGSSSINLDHYLSSIIRNE